MDVFIELDRVFRFGFDPTASEENFLCPEYMTKEEDCLVRSWPKKNFFMNPPYGRKELACRTPCEKKVCARRGHHLDEDFLGIEAFVSRAFGQWKRMNRYYEGVLLLPSRTDSGWFQYIVLPDRPFWLPFNTRLTFQGAKYPAPFPTILVALMPSYTDEQFMNTHRKVSFGDWRKL